MTSEVLWLHVIPARTLIAPPPHRFLIIMQFSVNLSPALRNPRLRLSVRNIFEFSIHMIREQCYNVNPMRAYPQRVQRRRVSMRLV